ncbi:MAG: FHA domain-containing protein [Planctomycetaceae bacterium]
MSDGPFMSLSQAHNPPRDLPDVAYLLVQSGPMSGEKFRISAGQITTIGRSPTNRIVVQDEISSRNHCEVFRLGDSWILRDLESRNGTRVNGAYVTQDCELESGQTIQIGTTVMLFTLDPNARYRPVSPRLDADTATEFSILPLSPEILHRARRSRYQSEEIVPAEKRERASRELSRLYRLALDMGAAENETTLSEKVLETLCSVTPTNIGAILLLPQPLSREPRAESLQIAAFRSTAETPYSRVSNFLSQAVLRDREAVLAKDVAADKHLANRDSLEEISTYQRDLR